MDIQIIEFRENHIKMLLQMEKYIYFLHTFIKMCEQHWTPLIFSEKKKKIIVLITIL